MNIMKKTQIALLAIALGISAVASAAQANKIGVVDMQKAIQTSKAGKTARTELETAFNKKKKELQAEEERLKKLQESFQKQQAALSASARQKKQAELQEKFMKYQELLQKSQADIQKREQEMSAPIIAKIREVVAELAKKKGLDAVLEKNENVVLFSTSDLDLTEEVLKALK